MKGKTNCRTCGAEITFSGSEVKICAVCKNRKISKISKIGKPVVKSVTDDSPKKELESKNRFKDTRFIEGTKKVSKGSKVKKKVHTKDRKKRYDIGGAVR